MRRAPGPLGPLNYHHLRIFWTVAREGSVTRAAARLHLAQSSVSGQLRTFERAPVAQQPLRIQVRQLPCKPLEFRGRPLLVVNTADVDFERNPEDLDDLLKQVRGMGKGTQYYVPRPR